MRNILISTAVAALALGAAQPAFAAKSAPAATAAVNGFAFADIDSAKVGTNAFKTRVTQRQTYYKAQLDQAEARRKALAAQLQPLVQKFNADQAKPNADRGALQQQAMQIQQIQENGRNELQQILKPYAYSEAYGDEQLEGQLQQAVDRAMAKRGVVFLLKPESLLQVGGGTTYSLTQDITNELNALVPSVQVVPPEGWEPRQIREARAAQAAQQQANPTSQQPSGR